MLMEGKPLLRIIRILKNQFDVIIIDGHGILHPRKCGWFPMWELRLTNQQ
jgi:deoxyribonuclease V